MAFGGWYVIVWVKRKVVAKVGMGQEKKLLSLLKTLCCSGRDVLLGLRVRLRQGARLLGRPPSAACAGKLAGKLCGQAFEFAFDKVRAVGMKLRPRFQRFRLLKSALSGVEIPATSQTTMRDRVVSI